MEKDKYGFIHFLQRESKILKINTHNKKWIVASENYENNHNEAYMSLVVDNGKFSFLFPFKIKNLISIFLKSTIYSFYLLITCIIIKY